QAGVALNQPVAIDRPYGEKFDSLGGLLTVTVTLRTIPILPAAGEVNGRSGRRRQYARSGTQVRHRAAFPAQENRRASPDLVYQGAAGTPPVAREPQYGIPRRYNG